MFLEQVTRPASTASPCGLAQPPSASSGTRRRISSRSCHACSTQRGGPTLLSPPSTTSAIEAVMLRAVRIREAVLDRMLAGQERHDVGPRHVAAQVVHEVTEVVFFLRADGAVG